MNNADVLALLATTTLSQVMSVYSGKAGACYCGCSGNHRYAAAHREAATKDRGYSISDDEVNDTQVKKVFNLVKKNFSIPENVRPGNEPYSIQDEGEKFVSHFSVEIGARSYTIYLAPKG